MELNLVCRLELFVCICSMISDDLRSVLGMLYKEPNTQGLNLRFNI